MDLIEIQTQDLSGNWRTYTITQNNSQLVTMAMKNLKEQFPEHRIRAVDSNGKLVDMLS